MKGFSVFKQIDLSDILILLGCIHAGYGLFFIEKSWCILGVLWGFAFKYRCFTFNPGENAEKRLKNGSFQ